jgi:hypothetical protein
MDTRHDPSTHARLPLLMHPMRSATRQGQLPLGLRGRTCTCRCAALQSPVREGRGPMSADVKRLTRSALGRATAYCQSDLVPTYLNRRRKIAAPSGNVSPVTDFPCTLTFRHGLTHKFTILKDCDCVRYMYIFGFNRNQSALQLKFVDRQNNFRLCILRKLTST